MVTEADDREATSHWKGQRGRRDVLAVEDGADLLKGLGHVEAHVGHLVVGHLDDDWEHLLSGDLLAAGL